MFYFLYEGEHPASIMYHKIRRIDRASKIFLIAWAECLCPIVR